MNNEFRLIQNASPVFGKAPRLPIEMLRARIEELEQTISRLRGEASAATANLRRTEEANLKKSRHLKSTIHDLRQPLQTLSLMQDALASGFKEASSPEFGERLESVVAAAAESLNKLNEIAQLAPEDIETWEDRAREKDAATPRRSHGNPRPAAHASALETPAVFVVDDDPEILDAMRDVLEGGGFSVEAFTGAPAFLNACSAERRGCVIVDAFMPGMDGFELIAHLKAKNYALPAIMITGAGDVPMAVRAMRAGAVDFIEKPVKGRQLLACLKRAMEAAPADAVSRQKTAAERFASLTGRQREIIDLILAGEPNKGIANRLGLSQRTVESHRAAIMKKAGARSFAALVRWAVAAG